MARGDVKTVRSNYSRSSGGWGGGGGSEYDDEGRGVSKTVWEWFESNFTTNPTVDWLTGLTDDKYYWLLKYSVTRYGIMDIAYHRTPGWMEHADTRAHRLVVKLLDEKAWLAFHEALVAGYERERNRITKEEHELAKKRKDEWDAYRAQQAAKQLVIDQDDFSRVAEVVELQSGMLNTDFTQAFVTTEKSGDAGDFIDNPVEAIQGQGGWGYEDDKATGIKLQITLSLDLSNSMYYNGIHIVAAEAFRDLGMTLRNLKDMYPNDLYIAFFTFSEDHWDKKGYRATRLLSGNPDNEFYFYEFENYKPSTIQSWGRLGAFDGEDTWFTPLFTQIEKWEKENSDPGAMRLDIVLTDAVFEHKKDIMDSDIIQERRNGALQTVMLNFMPESDWVNSTLPKRCYALAVDKNNVAGILRQVISEFVGAYL